MGGAVGLKGTDDLDAVARAKGARPQAGERAKDCLRLLAAQAEALSFFTASGEMGERELLECGLDFTVVYDAAERSSAEDTRACCIAFLKKRRRSHPLLWRRWNGARCGLRRRSPVPILGIPAGVKMHSGVFAISPEAAAELTLGYARGELLTRETEIVDVDEELYRAGELQTRLCATARTPYKPVLVQDRKRIYESRQVGGVQGPDRTASRAEFMRDGSAYILGAGTTTSRVAALLGLEKTLLGVDVLQNRN